MPSSTEQDAMPGTLLTNNEVGRLMRVIQDKTFSETRALADSLQLTSDGSTPLAEAEQALLKQTRADLQQFFDVIGDGTIQAGQDFSQSRDKEEVRQALRLRLGLPAISTVIAEQAAEADATRRRARRRCSSSFETKTFFS
jgi:hypothetical protein